MSRRPLVLTISLVATASCSHAPPPRTATVVQQATRVDPGVGIDAAVLRRDLFIFASDSFRGRETGTADAQRAAAFIAHRAQRLGLEPAGDSLYMQRVPLARQLLTPATRVAVVTSRGRQQALRLGTDVVPVLAFGENGRETKRNVEGEIIFVGYGPTDDDESAALARFDLAGKVLVAIHGAPPDVKPDLVRKFESRRMLGERMARLVALHPAAIVMLMAGGAEQLYEQTAPRFLRSVVLDRGTDRMDDSSSDSLRTLPTMLLGVARRGSWLVPSRWPNDASPQALGRELHVHIEVERQPFTGYNVAAVLRGSDPRLNKTYLAYGAHYDHLGVISPPRSGLRRARSDSIANGANDDGSGSMALLAVARDMSYLRPRRSVLFVWHVGGEKGLLGSAYFTAHPTVPIDSIVAEFNADAIAGGTDMVSLIGPRAAPNYSSWRVGMIVDSANRALPTPLKIDRRWDDPDDPDEAFARGDHINYARKGIPVIFFSSPRNAEYHSVSDEPDKIDYDNLAHIAQLMLESGFAVANRSSRPTSEVLTQSISSRQQ